MTALRDHGLMAIDPRPDRGGWIWGRHFRWCVRCTGEFCRDMKATECAECAYAVQKGLDLTGQNAA